MPAALRIGYFDKAEQTFFRAEKLISSTLIALIDKVEKNEKRTVKERFLENFVTK